MLNLIIKSSFIAVLAIGTSYVSNTNPTNSLMSGCPEAEAERCINACQTDELAPCNGSRNCCAEICCEPN